jgi:hypothetical protein
VKEWLCFIQCEQIDRSAWMSIEIDQQGHVFVWFSTRVEIFSPMIWDCVRLREHLHMWKREISYSANIRDSNYGPLECHASFQLDRIYQLFTILIEQESNDRLLMKGTHDWMEHLNGPMNDLFKIDSVDAVSDRQVHDRYSSRIWTINLVPLNQTWHDIDSTSMLLAIDQLFHV